MILSLKCGVLAYLFMFRGYNFLSLGILSHARRKPPFRGFIYSSARKYVHNLDPQRETNIAHPTDTRVGGEMGKHKYFRVMFPYRKYVWQAFLKVKVKFYFAFLSERYRQQIREEMFALRNDSRELICNSSGWWEILLFSFSWKE